MLSTFWLSSRDTAASVRETMSSKGFEVSPEVRDRRGNGVWLSIEHVADSLREVVANVIGLDPAAVLEASDESPAKSGPVHPDPMGTAGPWR